MEGPRRLDVEEMGRLRAKNRRLSVVAMILCLLLCAAVSALLVTTSEIKTLEERIAKADASSAREEEGEAKPEAEASAVSLANSTLSVGDDVWLWGSEETGLEWQLFALARPHYHLFLLQPPFSAAWWAGWVAMPQALLLHTVVDLSLSSALLVWVVAIAIARVGVALGPWLPRVARSSQATLDYIANPRAWFGGMCFRVAVLIYLALEQRTLAMLRDPTSLLHVTDSTLDSFKSLPTTLFVVMCLVWSNVRRRTFSLLCLLHSLALL